MNNQTNKKCVGVLLIGCKGAIATTLIAAQSCQKLNLKYSFQLPSDENELFRQLNLISLNNMVFGGWDVVSDSFSQSCHNHKIVPHHIVEEISEVMNMMNHYPAIVVESDDAIREILKSTHAHPRMQDPDFATSVFTKRSYRELIKSLEYDIEDFKKSHNLEKVIVVNVSSTEKLLEQNDVHKDLQLFEGGPDINSSYITAGMLYAYAAIKNGCHYINFTPSLTAEVPALIDMAVQAKVGLAGRDGKTGQTLYKTVLAPLFRERALKLKGWYSINILGNRDGLVLKEEKHKAAKIKSKTAVLESIVGYNDFDHQVHIHYYPPRGDAKEAWDNIDFSGWFDVPMQMKINWLGEDSILAAPLVCDLIRWVDFFTTHKEYGVFSQLASYFKDPLGCHEHDFFKQVQLLREHVLKKYV